MVRLIASVVFFTFLTTSAHALDPSENLTVNRVAIENLTGIKGSLDPEENSFLLSIPRNDLNIVVNGMQVTPEMGLTSRITFRNVKGQTILSGDLILSQDQVNPVMSVALNQGLDVTDLHNPFLWDSPRVMLMHIQATGDVKKLSSSLNRVLAEMRATINGNGDFPLATLGETETDLNVMTINSILNTKGSFTGSTYKVSFNRYAHENSDEINKEIAKHSWATFSGSNSDALLDGTVVVREAELQSVLKSLRSSQIYVLAIYQHSIGDDPSFIFVHYWGMGNARTLAHALRTTMVVAENHVESPKSLVASNEATVYPFLQNQSCNNNKRWTKEIYPGLFTLENKLAKVEKAEVASSIGFIDLIKTGIAGALLKSEEKANAYFTQMTAEWIHRFVVAKSKEHQSREASKVALKSSPVKLSTTQDFHNTGRLHHFLVERFHFDGNRQEDQLMALSAHDYNYLAQLQKSHPLTFPDASLKERDQVIPEAHDFNNIEKLADAIRPVLSILVAKQEPFTLTVPKKEYNYLADLKKAHPVIFIDAPSQSVATAQSSNDFNNREGLIRVLAVLLHVSAVNGKAPLTVEPRAKDYNYVATLQKNNPVTFDKNAVQPAAPIIDAAQKPMGHTYSFANKENITRVLAAGFQLKEMAPSEPLVSVQLQSKDYNYVAQIQKTHPVNFPEIKVEPKANDFSNSEVIAHAVASVMHVAVATSDSAVLRLEAKDYNYLTQLKVSHPIVFEETTQAPVVSQQAKVATAVAVVHANDFMNQEVLQQVLTHAMHIEANSREDVVAVKSEKIDYDYLTQLRLAHPVDMAEVSVPKMPIVTEQATKPSHDFTNNERIARALASAMQIKDKGRTATMLSSRTTDYNYVAQLQASHPVIFDVTTPVPRKVIVANVVPKTENDFQNTAKLSHLLASTLNVSEPAKNDSSATMQVNEKNYNYIAQLQQSHPVIFPEEKAATPVLAADAANVALPSRNHDFANTEKMTHLLATTLQVKESASPSTGLVVKEKTYNYVAMIQQSNPVVFPASKVVSPVTPSNDFTNHDKMKHLLANALQMKEQNDPSTQLPLKEKNYNYVAQLQKSRPVIFDVTSPIPRKVAIVSSGPSNFSNKEKVTHFIASAMNVKEPAASEAVGVKAQEKNYNYLASLQKANPVHFDEEKPAPVVTPQSTPVIAAAKPVMPVQSQAVQPKPQEVNHYALNSRVLRKDYNYAGQLQKTHPVNFDSTPAPALAMNKKLTTVLTTMPAAHSAIPTNQAPVQFAQNKNFQVPNQVTDAVALQKSDAMTGNLNSQAPTKPVQMVTRADPVIPVLSPKHKHVFKGAPQDAIVASSQPVEKVAQAEVKNLFATIATAHPPVVASPTKVILANATQPRQAPKPIFAENDVSADISRDLALNQKSAEKSLKQTKKPILKIKPRLAKNHDHTYYNRYLETPHLPSVMASKKAPVIKTVAVAKHESPHPLHKPAMLARHEKLHPVHLAKHKETTQMKLAERSNLSSSPRKKPVRDDFMPFDGIAE